MVVDEKEGWRVEKIVFEKGRCVDMEMRYMGEGKRYIGRKVRVEGEKVGLGREEFENEWVF